MHGRIPTPRITAEPAPVAGARWIALTRGAFALVDAADFEWLSRFSWFLHVPKNKRPMAARGQSADETKRHMILMHREIMQAPDGVQVDHRNLNDLDNRRLNLRFATNQQNHANRPAQRNNTSGFKGVIRDTRQAEKWIAKITVKQRTVHLGSFNDRIQAACAYNAAAMQHFGEFARLNQMD